MLAPAAMLGAAAGTAAGSGGGGGGGGPDGPPTNVSMFVQGEGDMSVQWSNGDSSAQTQLAFDTDSSEENPSPVTRTFSAGLTSGSTGATCTLPNPTCHWFIRHIKDEQTTDWVLATGCSGELCAE